MGGSKTYSVKKLKSGGKVSGSEQIGGSGPLLNAIASNVQNKIIAEALGATLVYSTPMGTLINTLKLIKLAYEMYSAGKTAFDKSGDKNDAIMAAAGVVITNVATKVKSEGIRLAVSYALNKQNIKVNETAKNIIVDSVSNTVEDSLK